MASLVPTGKQQYFDNVGKPLAGGKIFTYLSGTTQLKDTFLDADATAKNTNPIILDARGEATIFWSGTYKVVLKDALGNTIWTIDKIAETSLGSRTSTNGSAITPSGTTEQRDNPALPGYFRFNVDLNAYEGFDGAAWRSFIKSINGNFPAAGGDLDLNAFIKTVNGQSIVGQGDVSVGAPFTDPVSLAQIVAITVALS